MTRKTLFFSMLLSSSMRLVGNNKITFRGVNSLAITIRVRAGCTVYSVIYLNLLTDEALYNNLNDYTNNPHKFMKNNNLSLMTVYNIGSTK